MSKQLTKTAWKAILKHAEAEIASVGAYIAKAREDFEIRIGRFEVRQAIALDEGAEAKQALGEDWRKWGREVLAGKSAPTVYRWRNAGKVARILRGEAVEIQEGETRTITYPDNLLGEVPAALIGSLVPLYRILTDCKSEEEIPAAEALMREVYSDLLAKAETFTETVGKGDDAQTIVSKVPPTPEAVLAAAEAAAPATKGAKAKAKGETETKAKGDDSSEAKAEGETETESRRESSDGLVTVDATAVEAAAGPTDAIVKGLMREHGLTREVVLAIALATLRLAAEHGVTTVQAVLAHGTAAEGEASK